MEVIRWVARLGFERQKKHCSGPGGGARARLRGRWLWWWSSVGAKRLNDAFWSGSGLRLAGTEENGGAVVPTGILRGGGALGSSVKAYIHFCLDVLLYEARLMKRVSGLASGLSSIGR